MAAAIKDVAKIFYAIKFNKYISHRFLSSQKLSIRNILQLGNDEMEKTYIINGWIRGIRGYKEFVFADVFDGSCHEKLQVLLDNRITAESSLSVGSAVEIEGLLKLSAYKGQRVELHGKSLTVLGDGNNDDCPLMLKAKYAADILRLHPHLRPRTQQFGATLRVRDAANHALHDVLRSKGFLCIHTPILTTNDCEGGGAVFSVQTAADEKSCPKNNEMKSVAKKEDFFGTPVYMTVSGQLQLEAAASAFSRVYAFGPTFRAENSRSSRHLSEFYMLEVEKAFVSTLEDIMEVFESLMKEVTINILTNCTADIQFLHKENSPHHESNLHKMLSSSFVRFTYSEAINIISKKNDEFQNPIKYGENLGSEHEKFLVKYCGNQPIFITHFPADIKPFYMKQEDNNVTEKTATCFDVLVPYGGEICGGSLRENDFNILLHRLKQLHLDESLAWYLDLRKFGSAMLGGFGMGFERYLQYLLGIPNIKDTIPFPRWTKHCLM